MAAVSTVTKLTFMVPSLIAVASIVYASRLETSESDWFQLGKFFIGLLGMAVAALVAVVLAVIARWRGERRADLAVLGAIPAAVFLAGCCYFVFLGVTGSMS